MRETEVGTEKVSWNIFILSNLFPLQTLSKMKISVVCVLFLFIAGSVLAQDDAVTETPAEVDKSKEAKGGIRDFVMNLGREIERRGQKLGELFGRKKVPEESTTTTTTEIVTEEITDVPETTEGPELDNRFLIDAPQKGCPTGQRMTNRGQCRTVVK